MTDRKTLDQLNSDDLDELYYDIDNLHAAQESACKTVAAMHAAAVGEVRGPIRGVVEDVTDVRKRADRAEAALARITALAEEYPVGIDTALIHEALAHAEQPRATASRGADHGPSVADCAADDRAHWTQKYAGE